MAVKKVLVTGGAGYIGSHACKALANAGYLPVTYDSLVTGHREAVKWGPLEVGDTRDQARLGEVIRKYHPAAVMHFAAFIAVGESVQDPAKYYDNNLFGSLTLLQGRGKTFGASTNVQSSKAAKTKNLYLKEYLFILIRYHSNHYATVQEPENN